MNSRARSERIHQILESMSCLSRLGMGRMAHGAHSKDMPTHAQLGMMLVLTYRGAQSIKELAQQFGISSSATTQLVNGMVTEGLLLRTEDATDRRSIHVHLTAKGKKKLAVAKRARIDAMAKMFEPLADNELTQFLKLHQKMSDYFQKTCLPQ